LESLIIPIFVVFLVLFLVGAYFSHLHAQQRQQDLTELAAQLGWRFDPEEDYSHEEQYSQFGKFSQGDDRYAYNTLVGAIDVGGQAYPSKMGDYHYETTTRDKDGKSNTTTYTFSYLLVHLPYAKLPELLIRPEGIFDLVKRAFGFDDIDFESTEFSKRFFVKSSDKRFAYDVIHPKMMEFLLASKPDELEIAGECCLITDDSDWEANDFRRTLDFAAQFVGLWPKHLTSTLQQIRPESS
jgi:hypothetical protein